MADYFLVEQAWGPAWDPSLGRREQPGWDEHAVFMDGLVADGLIVMGGPAGDIDTDTTVLVFDAPSEDEIRRRLAADPWYESTLTIASIRPWTLWLRAD